jgi:peptidyl-prolyl cis-trans isomerase SurA
MFFSSVQSRFNSICGLVLLLLCSFDVFAVSESLDKIITVINDDIITQNELLTEINFIKKQLRQQNRPIPRDAVLHKQMLERLIQKRLQLQMAEKAHIRIADETLDNAILNIASQNNMSLTQFRNALEDDGYEFDTYRKIIRDEITINQLRQRLVVNRISVTEQETQDFLANKALQGGRNDEFRVAHILIEVPEAASSEQVQVTKQKAQEVLDKIINGEEFTELAAAFSDGQKALEGGDLGWRKLGQLPVLFSNVVTTMEINGVSTLIRSPSGFHIIKLTDKRTDEKKLIIVQTKARHILVKVDELTTDHDARTKLEQLKRRIDLGDSFEEVAKSHSDDAGSAANGGSLGWVSPGVMVPQFERQMDKLDIGQMSEPFKTQFGWHIIHVQERRDHDNTEETNITSAKRQIRERKIEEETQNWLRRLRDEAYVEIRI